MPPELFVMRALIINSLWTLIFTEVGKIHFWYLSLDLHIIIYNVTNYYCNLCRIISKCSFSYCCNWLSFLVLVPVKFDIFSMLVCQWLINGTSCPWWKFGQSQIHFMITMYGLVWMNIHSDQYKYRIYKYIRVLFVCLLVHSTYHNFIFPRLIFLCTYKVFCVSAFGQL